MKRLATLALALPLVLPLSAAGIDFFPGSWEEALATAEAQDKLIFVDAYASWCGPCKRMAANVFPQDEVGEFFNANFINVKLDYEKAEANAFRKTHRVGAFPTLFFISGQNNVVHKTVGGKSVASLIAAGNAALAKLDDLDQLAADWETQPHTSARAFRYVRALVRKGENHRRVANDYLREPDGERSSPDNLRLLLVAATEADSRIFDLLVEQRAAVVALEGQEAFDRAVAAAVKATVDKATEYRDEELLSTAVQKMALVDAAAAKRLALEGRFELTLRGQSPKDFARATKKYLAKGAAGDAERLRHVFAAASGSKFAEDAKVRELTIAAGEGAAEASDEPFRDYYTLARFLDKQGDATRALHYARRALDSLGEVSRPNYRRAVEGLIRQIESKR